MIRTRKSKREIDRDELSCPLRCALQKKKSKKKNSKRKSESRGCAGGVRARSAGTREPQSDRRLSTPEQKTGTPRAPRDVHTRVLPRGEMCTGSPPESERDGRTDRERERLRKGGRGGEGHARLAAYVCVCERKRRRRIQRERERERKQRGRRKKEEAKEEACPLLDLFRPSRSTND